MRGPWRSPWIAKRVGGSVIPTNLPGLPDTPDLLGDLYMTHPYPISIPTATLIEQEGKEMAPMRNREAIGKDQELDPGCCGVARGIADVAQSACPNWSL